MEKTIKFIAILLGIICFMWLIAEPEMETAAEEPEYTVYTHEEFRVLIVDQNLHDFYKDEDWGEYACEKLGISMVPEITGTVYNAVEAQCDGSPLRTADGSYINKDKVNSGETRWIAVSRDLLEIFKYGDKVEVCGAGEEYDGIWEIHDTMNSRFESRIDFLVPDEIKVGKWDSKITLYSVLED